MSFIPPSPYSYEWVGFESVEAVVNTRLHCYADSMSSMAEYRLRMTEDKRARDGDFMLLRKGSENVGTATSLSLTMHMRGASVSCQGVAWVGTVRHERRKSGGGKSAGGAGAAAAGIKQPGVATQVMRLMLDRARQRGEIVSALMPFRASFYEHFGYGMAERRTRWTIPTSLLPTHGDTSGFRPARADDIPALMELRGGVAQRGQCDFDRTADTWKAILEEADKDGFAFIDRPLPLSAGMTDPAHGFVTFETVMEGDIKTLLVTEYFCRDMAALVGLLAFLGSMKDQYARVVLHTPGDLPLNRLLSETQLPHRNVSHPTAMAQQYTRMQIRVLDHGRLISALPVPGHVRGKASVCVRECEGTESRFELELEGGRGASKATTVEPGFACDDKVWASVISGDLPASRALMLGLASGSMQAATLLDAYAVGPAPFSGEYF
jgi:predicted acetyltransferase